MSEQVDAYKKRDLEIEGLEIRLRELKERRSCDMPPNWVRAKTDHEAQVVFETSQFRMFVANYRTEIDLKSPVLPQSNGDSFPNALALEETLRNYANDILKSL